MAASECGAKFEFRHLPNAALGKFSKETDELFQKWYVLASYIADNFSICPFFRVTILHFFLQGIGRENEV